MIIHARKAQSSRISEVQHCKELGGQYYTPLNNNIARYPRKSYTYIIYYKYCRAQWTSANVKTWRRDGVAHTAYAHDLLKTPTLYTSFDVSERLAARVAIFTALTKADMLDTTLQHVEDWAGHRLQLMLSLGFAMEAFPPQQLCPIYLLSDYFGAKSIYCLHGYMRASNNTVFDCSVEWGGP